MHCGVLGLQGDWAAHAAVLRGLGAETSVVRTAVELAAVDALVLPGGESTAMLTLMEADGLDEKIRDRVEAGMPVLATCAGVILLARATRPAQRSLGLLDCDVERNAYGRQVHSTVAEIELADEFATAARMEAVFIRAPRITRIGPAVAVLGRLGQDPVLVRQGRIIAATFHPELTDDERIHRLLVDEEADRGP
ncbi:MAG: pyridoxal 5'-phosphate synthase glutaminase subunit PdxT [Thermoanaerobaculales bacterium]|jgi:5'-phosphate synthase pdxT subunit|nr:pyridoxal 5'-phosphate synthase glutaminase subunit PdxT [Thermoanaerobaculales bacterium]